MNENLLRPKHPERICWGCDLYCPAHDLRCRETRVPHPIEPFGGCGPEGSEYASNTRLVSLLPTPAVVDVEPRDPAA
ncbi:MAG: DUF3079 domain-containing protein [Acidobacteria bacterium]|nr:DUF3079 domain-containing protein [Acidobacteriota bacterium]